MSKKRGNGVIAKKSKIDRGEAIQLNMMIPHAKNGTFFFSTVTMQEYLRDNEKSGM